MEMSEPDLLGLSLFAVGEFAEHNIIATNLKNVQLEEDKVEKDVTGQTHYSHEELDCFH